MTNNTTLSRQSDITPSGSSIAPSSTPTAIELANRRSNLGTSSSRHSSRSPKPFHSAGAPEPDRAANGHAHPSHQAKAEGLDSESDSGLDNDGDGKADSMSRPSLHSGRSHLPLLQDDDRGRQSYDAGDYDHLTAVRRAQLRSRSPNTAAQLASRKKYTYAAFFLGLSLVSFTIQTETAVYIQHTLGWKKAYCMLYVCSLTDPFHQLTPVSP